MAKHPTTRSEVTIVDEDYFTNGTVTTCTLTADIQHDRDQKFTGTVRRHPDDGHDIDVAMMLAYARAYDSLASTLKRRAQGLVKHMDDITADRAKKASKKKPQQVNVQQIRSSAV